MANKVWYDLDPMAADLWVVEGPEGYDINAIDPDHLPEGFRWIEDAEWAEKHQKMEIVKA